MITTDGSALQRARRQCTAQYCPLEQVCALAGISLAGIARCRGAVPECEVAHAIATHPHKVVALMHLEGAEILKLTPSWLLGRDIGYQSSLGEWERAGYAALVTRFMREGKTPVEMYRNIRAHADTAVDWVPGLL